MSKDDCYDADVVDDDDDAALLCDDEPPLNLAAAAKSMSREARLDDDGPYIKIYGHDYEYDKAADFSNILPPSLVTGTDVALVCVITVMP